MLLNFRSWKLDIIWESNILKPSRIHDLAKSYRQIINRRKTHKHAGWGVPSCTYFQNVIRVNFAKFGSCKYFQFYSQQHELYSWDNPVGVKCILLRKIMKPCTKFLSEFFWWHNLQSFCLASRNVDSQLDRLSPDIKFTSRFITPSLEQVKK